MTNAQKAELIELITELHDHARDYGRARGNNDAYRLAKNKGGLYFADTLSAAAKADAAMDNVLSFIENL